MSSFNFSDKKNKQTFFKFESGHEMTIVKFQRKITTKLYKQELRFLCSAGRLMMLYISMKFHDSILSSFQVIERTQNYLALISKGNNSKNVKTRAVVLLVCMSTDDVVYFYEVSRQYLERFSSYRVDTIAWETDGQTDAKTLSLHYCQGET